MAVYLPYDLIASLSLKEGDEVDFFKFSSNQYLVVKKSDVLAILTKQSQKLGIQQPEAQRGEIDAEELAVLKKLDTLRYADRTKEKVSQILNDNEKRALQKLLKNKSVNLYKKPGEATEKYGIAKSIYDKFLYGKRERAQSARPIAIEIKPQAQEPKKWEKELAGGNYNVATLESQGYIVIANQSEAAVFSAAIEESIRRGLVVGTRAFNRKFYIALKSFVTKNAPKVLRVMNTKGTKVEELARDSGVDEDGVRAILYILSESGDVSEVKRDIFRIVE